MNIHIGDNTVEINGVFYDRRLKKPKKQQQSPRHTFSDKPLDGFAEPFVDELDALKALNETGDYIFYYLDAHKGVWEEKQSKLFFQNIKYKPIHKKHADIAQAVANNQGIKIEAETKLEPIRWDSDNIYCDYFFEEYDETINYRLKSQYYELEDDEYYKEEVC